MSEALCLCRVRGSLAEKRRAYLIDTGVEVSMACSGEAGRTMVIWIDRLRRRRK